MIHGTNPPGKITGLCFSYRRWNRYTLSETESWFSPTIPRLSKILHEKAAILRGNTEISLRIGGDDVLYCDSAIAHIRMDALGISHSHTVIPKAGHNLTAIVRHRYRYGAAASRKVLIDLFQKVVGIAGAKSLIEDRSPRNTHIL